jgi:concanavalin A-like lectin/glucanase superfamily protein
MALNPPQLNPLLSFPDNSQLPEMSVDGIVIDRIYGATGVLDTLQSTTTSQYQDPNSNQINPPAQSSLPNQGNNTIWYSTLVDDVYNTGFALSFQFSRVTYINYVTFDLLNVPCSWQLLQVSGTYSPIVGGNILVQGIVNGTNNQGWINFEETLPETYYFDSSTNLVLVITKLSTGTQYNFGVQNFLTKLVVQTIEDLEMNLNNVDYDQTVSSYNPTAYWRLADAVDSTIALDSSNNGHLGTVVSGVTFGVPGPITGIPADTAALFNGSTGYITTYVAPPEAAAYGFIAAANIQATGADNSVQTIVSCQSNTGVDGISLAAQYNGSGALEAVEFNHGTGATIYQANWSTPTSGWHLFACTWDGSSNMYLYCDGNLVGSAFPTTFTPGTQDWIIGADKSSGTIEHFFTNSIAQVAIFDTLLTAPQVTELYNTISVAGPYILPSMTTQNNFGFVETFTPVVYDYSNFQIPDQESVYWKCTPQPVKDAVVWFTLDLEQTQTINRMYVDPLYTGCSFNLYWSVDNINWTPINQDLTLHKGMYCLDPICARYLKLEFSQLVPEVYNLPFDAINRVVQVFPDYVDTYFLGLEQALLDAPAQTYNNLVGNSPNILYNTSPSITSNYGALAGQLSADQYGGSPANLGLANLGDNSSSYSVVDPTVSYKNLQDVANEGSIFSNVGDTPFMNRRFYQYGPHTYKEVLINQTWHEAYFVGLKYLSFYNIEQIGFPQ